jgi:ribonuclease P/MRP protein subunit POP5
MIKPSSREKKRYILFEIISDSKFFKDEIENSIYQKTLEFLGEEGFSKSGVKLVKDNIVKVNNKFKDKMIIILSLIRTIKDKKVMINTLKTSGVLKKVKK